MNIESITEFQVHMSRDSDATAAKTPLEVMTDSTGEISEMMPAKTVSVITSACFYKVTKVISCCLNILPKKDEQDRKG